MTETISKVEYPSDAQKRTLLYASPRFGVTLFMSIVDFGLLFLYEQAYQLNSFKVGVGLMIGKFAIAISQFLFGWLSDHTHTKWGRRKPYLFIMSPILAISFVLLLIPGLFIGATPPENLLFAWFCIFNAIAQASYAVTTVYHAWMAEQFPAHLRPQVSTRQNALNFIGTAVIIIFSMVVLTDLKDRLEANPADIPLNYIISVIIFALIMIGLMYLTAIKMPIENTPDYTSRLIDDLETILSNKNMLLVCGLQGISSFAWAMSQSTLLTYAELVLKIKDTAQIIISGVLVIAMLGGLYFWRKRIEEKGKKNTLLQIFLFAILVLPFTILGAFPFATTLFFAIPFIIGVALSLGGWYLFPYIMYADIAQDDEMETGELKAGIYTGFPAILLNIFQALSLLFTGWVHQIQPEIRNLTGTDAFSIGYILWGPIAAGILLISLFYARKLIKLDFNWEKAET